MPSYINPKFVHVEPRGGFPVVAVAVLAVIGYLAYQVAEWLASVIVAIEATAAVVTAGAVTGLVLVLRRQRGRAHLDAPEWVVERLGAPRVRSSAAVADRQPAAVTARSRRQIEAQAIHYHLYLHAAPAAQPIAIEEDQ